MANNEALFRNSVWSHENGDISLHNLNELDMTWTNSSNDGLYSTIDPVSKFSADTDDDDSEYVGYFSPRQRSSPSSNFSRRAEGYVERRVPGQPLPMPRTYAIAQQPRRYVEPRIGSDDRRRPRPPRQSRSRAAIQYVPPTPEPNRSLLRENLVFITICIAHLCARKSIFEAFVKELEDIETNLRTEAGIGQTLPIIKGVGSRFRVMNANTLSPAIAAYAIALGTFILVAGRLGETFGHRRIFIAGLLWSAVWPLIAGASFYSTRSLFIFCRALQGLGTAFTLPTGLELLRATRPRGVRKTILFTVYAAMPPIGLMLGALVSSSFVTFAWWPWTYWAHSMTLVVVGAMSFFTIPSAAPARSLSLGARAITLKLDIPGMVTGTMSLGLFGFAWCQAHVVGWQQSYLWIILAMSVVLAGLFVMIEGCYAPKPLIPYSALSSEVFWILVAIGCGWSCFGIWIFYGWQLVERLRATPALLVSYTMQ